MFSSVKPQISNINSPDNRLKFANYLFNEKDYLRALNEYKEYLKQNQNDTAYFKYAESFLRIGRFEEAAENFKSLFFNSSLEDEAKLEFFKAHFLIGLNSKNFSYFRNLFSKEVYSTTKYYKEIKRLTLISHFFDNSALPDTNEFFSTFDDSNYVSIKNFYLIKKSPKYKNPNKAGILSAILPGLGKIYSGKISDGITSFITTCLFTFFSIDNFKHNHHFRGWLFAGLSAITYAGNIYGSIASTHIYNARLKNDFNNKIKYYFEERNFLLPNIEFVNR